MEEALEMVRSKDAKERMAGVEHLYHLLEVSTKSLSPAEVASLVDCCLDILKDNSNFRVSQGALQSLASAAVLSGDHFKLHFNALLPSVVERLGDGKQPVRDASRRLLLTLMEVSLPTIIVERAGSYAWMHKNWRVREEFARTVTSAIGLFASTELPLQRVLLPPVLQLLNDSNQPVREAAILCIEEMYTQFGRQFHDELQRHYLPTSLVKEINSRLEHIEPKSHSSDGIVGHFVSIETKPNSLPAYNQKRISPKVKSTARDSSHSGGESDVTEKQIDPIKVYSGKELVREIEKVAATLVPEKDWSLRIAAMQRVEGLVFGGAADYPSFPTLLKQLVPPLCTQLSDRRSSIVKQACHLLNLLSKELLGDFEASAEMFIPVLFKLVVITVLVIAESADNCIKTMVRNCKVARVLPRIADCAKNDRNSVLRARCCEYALLILEYWADAPEIRRSADLYEDLIKCCVADAMSEVRSTARTCYRMFTKTWPGRSEHLFSSFDPAVQRLISDEDGGMHRRYASPSHRERGQLPRTQSQTISSDLHGFGTSAIVSMDKSASLSSGTSLSSASVLLSQTKSVEKGADRSLESVLHASKQKVTAIESMLRGLDMQERFASFTCSTSLDLGVDAPSSHDPPFPPAVRASDHLILCNLESIDPAVDKIAGDSAHNGGSVFSDLITTQIQPSKDPERASYFSNLKTDLSSVLSFSNTAKRSSIRAPEGSSSEENTDLGLIKRFPNMHIDKQFLEAPYRDAIFRDPHGSYIPNFQRPLLRKQASGRTSASSRHSFDDSQLSFGDMPSYMDGPASLSEALAEGLSPSSDWCARVAAFNYLRNLLQQGPKGIQEVTQSFEKVMKLFFQHLDDPHHKVAQAALSTLTDVIPTCRKPFESYLERILPHVFSRLIDPKEVVRQPCSTTLDIVSKTYGIDSLLPAFLRSLDEQRSPKAKLAVIEFAINSFNKHSMNSEGPGNNVFLKLWFAKLSPLTHDKNIKLREAAITCIISVYSHYDSALVLNFILSLSVEEQNSLRRALKQYTPRIEVDLMNYFQNKKERQQRSKILYDQSDLVGSSPEEGYVGISKKIHLFGRYSGGSIDSDSGRKMTSMIESMQISESIGLAISDDADERFYQNFDDVSSCEVYSGGKDLNDGKGLDHCPDFRSSLVTSHLDVNSLLNSDTKGANQLRVGSEEHPNVDINQDKWAITSKSVLESCPSIPQLLHKICNGNAEDSIASKHRALQQLVETSITNDNSVWTKYFNQILTAVLDVLDDVDYSVRELGLSLIAEMLNNQKGMMEDSVEIIIEKLLNATKDSAAKVSNEADHCLSIILSQYDPYRCLTIVVPLLVGQDEKTLVTCINCLMKLVGRLSQEEVMAQLPSFLPALFDAFGDQSADVRKTVVFCLVDIYIMLGKAFLPHLQGLNSTQLRLVTIYANRISYARSGVSLDATHG